ncbi:hypothetical protein FNH22_14570 [Fulvivirga sp. M361]|uniref:hypothetical protein n=1 Tax=Fulvivirga sp. M361 TaxID=2594266 RepID=UPI001179C7AC|nr:hypothetical protein [Fulvivirga sp. M361]TRX58279.1 hypothetical protein FNH22_14570 [Fulvivirga sp. M361]
MNHKEFLYFILYKAFIVLREEGHFLKNKKTFWISDFLHNLPMELKGANSIEEFQKIFSTLQESASYEGMKKWFDSIVEDFDLTLQMKKNAEDSSSDTD